MAIIKPEQLRSGSYSISGSFSGSFQGDGSEKKTKEIMDILGLIEECNLMELSHPTKSMKKL
jgi:hypothetical protein